MNLTAPSDLPTRLAGRWQRVRERLAAIPDSLLAKHPRAVETLPRVAICSEFALTTLLRHPEPCWNAWRTANRSPRNAWRSGSASATAPRPRR